MSLHKIITKVMIDKAQEMNFVKLFRDKFKALSKEDRKTWIEELKKQIEQ